MAVVLAGCLILASLSLTLTLPLDFAYVLAFYAVATTAYTFVLKRKLLVDVFTLAGLYTVRIVAGAAATDTQLSFWLLAFSIFFFLSLALVKRYVELNEFEGEPDAYVPGRGYQAVDFDMVGRPVSPPPSPPPSFWRSMCTARDGGHVLQSAGVWPLCPLVLYMLLRIWMLARRRMLHEDPVVFIMHDWRSIFTVGVGAALVVAGTIGS